MHIKKTIQYALIAFSGLLTSCITDIDLDYLKPAPKLVLNSIAKANEPIAATVSRTWFYTEENPNVTLKDARVDLYVNDTFREQLTWREGDVGYNSTGFYLSTYRPVVGERVKLIANAPDFKEAGFETTVPDPCQLLRCVAEINKDTINYGSSIYITYRLTFYITLKDEGADKNYYLVRTETGIPWQKENDTAWHYTWVSVGMEYSSEPLFDNDLNALDKVMGDNWLSGYYGRVFSDELINGEEYTLKIKSTDSYGSSVLPPETDEENPNPEPPRLYRVYLYSLSEDYYKYMKTLQSNSSGSFSNELVNAGLAEPIQIYSNVSGGVGIGGACNPSSLTMEATVK